MTTAAALPDAVVLLPPAAALESPALLDPDRLLADGPRDDTPATLELLRLTAGITQPWQEAVLRAVGQWTLPSEIVAGQRWQYVIGGEALDWLTLAHRLAAEIPDAIPPRELEALLFCGRLPGGVDPERFRRLIGTYRYTAHLNYQYGVVVEEALQLAVEESIRKHHLALCYGDSAAIGRETYRHLYGDTEESLYQQFAAAAGDGQASDDGATLSLAGYREFTYWLFKWRIRKWHPARVASDTRRGLDKLRELRAGAISGRAYGDFMPAPEWDAPYALPGGRV